MDPALVSRLTYVVLDEREPAAPLSVIGDDQGGQLLFLLTNWPRVDALGRVRHGTGRPVEIAVPVNRWQATMTERRLPEVLRERPPRIGDTFAMMLESRHPKYLLNPIGPVVDVTADARDAAKEAFYGAVAAPLDAEGAVVVAQVETTASLPEPEQWRAYLERSR
jgi:hypothetical protein